MNKAEIGLLGLGVMGSSLARNIAGKGFKTIVYNVETQLVDKFISDYGTENLFGAKSLEEFIQGIERPRRVILMIKAGDPVDEVISNIKDMLDEGDMIVDCGNSNYMDTIRRTKYLEDLGIDFVGCGVSGGEEGALKGPSIMPGGTDKSWESLKPVLEAIAAKDFDGKPCVTHVGTDGAGHYVKMIHNGIEYGVMQTIAEAYDAFKTIYNLSPLQISEIFQKYNEGKLKSYLFEITGYVLKQPDKFNQGKYLIDYILDKAGEKGTGKWTVIDAIQRGVAVPSISQAVFARAISAKKDIRTNLSKKYDFKLSTTDMPLEDFILKMENALYIAMLSNYAQGYSLIQLAAVEQGRNIDLGEISRIWEGGCIIRAEILHFIHNAFQSTQDKSINLLEIPEINTGITQNIKDYADIVSMMNKVGVASHSLGAGLSYIFSMTDEVVSANLIQGLRDYFGAHTYLRTDRDGVFHTDWN